MSTSKIPMNRIFSEATGSNSIIENVKVYETTANETGSINVLLGVGSLLTDISNVHSEYTFVLPTILNATTFNQCRLSVSVTAKPTSVNFGTNLFYGKTAPVLEIGNYVLMYDYDPKTKQWVLGVLEYGEQV